MELVRDGHPLLFGHRGAAALAGENTHEAIAAAAEAGVDGVELDVLRDRAGGLVIAHGPEIPPDAPSLAAALAAASELGLLVQLDVKVGGVEADVVGALGEAEWLDRSLVSSCLLPSLVEFSRHAPELARSLTYPEDRFGVSGSPILRPLVRPGLAAMRSLLPRRLPRWLAAVDVAAATLNWAVVTPAAIDICHRRGVAVYVWTVNDPALAETLVEMGADAIITDDPRIGHRGTPES